jgi:hypothetical protein
MRNSLRRLWNDDEGSVLAVEWIIITSVLLLGAVAGLAAFRHAADAEARTFTTYADVR